MFFFLAVDRDVYTTLSSYRYTPRVGSPLSIDDPVQRVRQQNLISRWNDMFSQDRLDAMDTLRRYSDDYENNQRIIFLALQVNSEALYTLLYRIIIVFSDTVKPVLRGHLLDKEKGSFKTGDLLKKLSSYKIVCDR